MPARTAQPNALIKFRFGRLRCAMLLSLATPFSTIAAEDPYLSAISVEAEKVDAAAQPTLDSPAPQPTNDGGVDLRAFEEDLKARYKGSYTFYAKLPQRSREEIFQEYRDGASIDALRKKIMDRFMHQ